MAKPNKRNGNVEITANSNFFFDFIGKKKYTIGFACLVILIGIVFTIINGVRMDIQFVGGTIIKYTYEGALDTDEVQNVVKDTIGQSSTIQLNSDYATSTEKVVISLTGHDSLSSDQEAALDTALKESFPDSALEKYEVSNVDPYIGHEFLQKSLLAVAIAIILTLVYIGYRFRRIGGWSAGIVAVIALIHDVLAAFFTFVIFRIPLDDNFIAVVLTILGYSINATIVIYDRIRENRRYMGKNDSISDVVNKSINQSFTRCVNTNVATLIAIGLVCVFSLVYSIDAITSFALPMMVGIVCGAYSSTFLSGPLWAMWQEKQIAAKKAARAK